MSSSHSTAVPALALLLFAACATPAPPKPVPQLPALEESRAADAEPLAVRPGRVRAQGAVGGDTGVRTAWYRFRVDEPGDAELTLDLEDSDDLLSLALFDASIVQQQEANPPALEFLLTRSADKSIETTLTPGEYYVRVATGYRAELAGFDLDVAFRPSAQMAETPHPAEAGPVPPAAAGKNRREEARADSRSARDDTFAGREPHRPSHTLPVQPPPEPVEPPPPVKKALAEPSRQNAQRLLGGCSFIVPIGGDSGMRWAWFQVDLIKNGKLVLDLATNGAPAQMMLTDSNGQPLMQMNIVGTGSHNQIHNRGKYYIRVGPAMNDAASRVTIAAKIHVAPQLSGQKPPRC